MASENLFSGCQRINPSIVLFIIFYLHQISAQNMLTKNYNCTNTIGNYTEDSAFHAILNDIISSPWGSSIPTLGKGNDQVNVRAFCGRDRYLGGFCDRCIADAMKYLIKVCPVQKEGIVWYDYGDCMFRYSNKSINRKMSLTPFYKNISSTVVATNNAYWFSRNLTALADRLVVKASNSYRYDKYAADDDIFINPNGVAIYGYMDCTPDISSIDCKSCLNHTKNELLSCCDNVVGARYHTPSCSFRFETYPFRYQIAENLVSYKCTNTIGNFTQDDIFHTILNDVISDPWGFNNLTLGKGIDRVSTIAFFGGNSYPIDDDKSRDKCIRDAINVLTKVCPVQKEAIVWFEDCMFRYSNKSIHGKMSLTPFYKNVSSTVIATNKAYWFSRNLTALADRLLVETPNRYDSYKYAADDAIHDPNGESIYGYMECTPDISAIDCTTCLNHTKNELLSCCDRVVGARYHTPSCAFRFEIYPFRYHVIYASVEAESTSKKVVIVVSVVVSLLVITLSLVVFITRRRWKEANAGHRGEEHQKLLKSLRTETIQYDLVSIRAATNQFSTANRLGSGGFGEVYKGVLSDGKEIAVKRLSATSGQGNEEFKNEILLLARLQHSCLVKLLGFCLDKKERLLVYEFMANGSLDKVLFDQENRSRLDWEGRYKIIKSVARGLLYLHEDSRLMIIHRDLKASNILLDGDMNAKISDFGMAKLYDQDEGEVTSQKIAGTLGYMAPEYAMHGLFSVKSDVYSYGVLLLEIISGKRNQYSLTEDTSEGLLSYAYKAWKEGKASDLIDPVLTNGSDSPENIMRCIHIALLCAQDNVGNRPTMASVNLMLQSSKITLPIPFEPGFYKDITRSWHSELLVSTAHNDLPLNEETDS